MGTTITSGFTSTVSTTESGFLIDNGGTLAVVAGGTVDGVLVLSGGSARFSAGALIDNLILSGGGQATVSSGATVNGADVSGLLTVSADGTVADGTLMSQGTLLVSSGGTASSGSIAGGTETVMLGGTDIGAIVDAGTLQVSSGGLARNTFALLDGAVVVMNGGTEQVTAFGSAADVTVDAGGTLIVGSRGTASSTTVLSGATVGVSSGGTLISTRIASGGDVIVANGGVESGNIIEVSGSETVLAGGSAIASIIGASLTPLSGAVLTVSSGGVATGTLLTEGALVIDAGGVAINPLNPTSGSIVVSSGGLLSQTTSLAAQAGVTLDAGGAIALALGGVVADVLVQANAVLSLGQAQGAFSGTVANGGSVLVGAGATEESLLVMPGGSETVQSGGRAAGTVVSGTMTVASGGVAGDTQVALGGLLTVENGGTAIDTNGFGTVAGSNQPFSGGTTMIDSGGTEIDTGNAAGITLAAGGVMTVVASNSFTSAVATGTDILSGGDLVVSNGGTVGVTTLNAGGTLDLLSGAKAVLVQITGGTLNVGAGAAIGAAAVQNGAVLNILSGAVGELVGVSAGGVATVLPGAGVSGAGVSGTGVLALDAGAVVLGGLAYAGYGGLMSFQGTQMPSVPISGFGPDDTIALPDIAFDPNYAIASASNVLSLSENGQTYTFNLLAANLGGQAITVAPGSAGGTVIEVACFAAGTRIATPAGEVAVDTLRAGDTVLALVDGAWAPRPVRWVGHTDVDLARHPHPEKAAPVRIRADAVAPGAPVRDLLLSPDHAVLIDCVLMQAQALCNGATVVQEFPRRISYFHVELDRHAVLCADGLAVESYLDTGNRALFAGEAGARPLHPDLIAAAWAQGGCAPLVLTGPEPRAARSRLLARAVDLGFTIVTDPAPRIATDRTEIPCRRRGAGWSATLPAGTRTARILSRHFVPTWFEADDRRRLGIAVRALRLDGRPVPARAHGTGWHAPEGEWRWTNGDAAVTLAAARQPTRLWFATVDAGARYWLAPSSGPAAATPCPAARSRPRPA